MLKNKRCKGGSAEMRVWKGKGLVMFSIGELVVHPMHGAGVINDIVLEKIAESFEPGRVYPEREVNLIIADFHDDFCTIRREMIAEGIMERERGEYRLK